MSAKRMNLRMIKDVLRLKLEARNEDDDRLRGEQAELNATGLMPYLCAVCDRFCAR